MARIKYRNDLTAERLRELLNYDPETGVFTRRVAKGGNPIGSVVGCKTVHGYLVTRVDDVLYQCSRLAWLYVHGSWPTHCVDHINACTTDNRIANLRAATVAQNMHNTRRPITNSSGLKGAAFMPKLGKWRARIQNRHLGVYATKEEAHAVYVAEAKKLFGEFACWER